MEIRYLITYSDGGAGMRHHAEPLEVGDELGSGVSGDAQRIREAHGRCELHAASRVNLNRDRAFMPPISENVGGGSGDSFVVPPVKEGGLTVHRLDEADPCVPSRLLVKVVHPARLETLADVSLTAFVCSLTAASRDRSPTQSAPGAPGGTAPRSGDTRIHRSRSATHASPRERDDRQRPGQPGA